jgi:hypothetical protein
LFLENLYSPVSFKDDRSELRSEGIKVNKENINLDLNSKIPEKRNYCSEIQPSEPKNSVFGENEKCFQNIKKQDSKKTLTKSEIRNNKKTKLYTPIHENKTILRTLNEKNEFNTSNLQNNKNLPISRNFKNMFDIKNDNLPESTNFKRTDNNLKSKVRENSKLKVLCKSYSKSEYDSRALMKKLLQRGTPNRQEICDNESFMKKTVCSINKAIEENSFLDNCIHTIKKDKIKIKFSSINLSMEYKIKMTYSFKLLYNSVTNKSNIHYEYLGESFEDIEKSDFVILNFSTINSKNDKEKVEKFTKDMKILYLLLINQGKIQNRVKDGKIKMLNFNFILDSIEKNKALNVDNYLINSIDYNLLFFEKQEKVGRSKLPLYGFKIFLVCNEDLWKEIYAQTVKILGGSVVEHIRLSDICLINKVEKNIPYPPHVRKINYDFLFDCLEMKKLPELELVKYQPSDEKYKKNRK